MYSLKLFQQIQQDKYLNQIITEKDSDLCLL